MGIRVENRTPQVISTIKNRAVYTLFSFGNDVKKESLPKTPLKYNNLRKSVNVKSNQTSTGAKCEITWEQPYAAYQERGMRYDGTHVVRHYTTPGTGPWFAKNAVNSQMRKMQSHLDRAALLIR